MKDSFMTEKDIKKMGFKSVGANVLISKKASFYNNSLISIGSNVRIDDFCVLSGRIQIDSNVHVSAGSFLFGGEDGIFVGKHVSISSRCAIYSITDDFSGNYLVGSIEPIDSRNVISRKIIIDDFSVLGTGSTVLPGAKFNMGSCVGAMSLVKIELKPWSIYVGVPCRFYKKRAKNGLRFLK